MEKRTFKFWETFRSSNTTVLHDKNYWIQIAGGPWLLTFLAFILLLAFGIDPTLPPEELEESFTFGTISTSLLSFILNMAAIIIFYVRVLRYKLLGEVPESFLSLEWKMRHWKLIGNSILLILALIVPMGIFFGIGAYFAATDNVALSIVFFVLGTLAIIYIASRLYLFSAVVATDGSNPLKTSWGLTSGWTWLKLLALTLIVALPVAIVLNIVSGVLGYFVSLWLHNAINTLFTTFVVNIIVISTIASVYKQLSKS